MERSVFLTRMPSSTDRRVSYEISFGSDGELHCTCPHHAHRAARCKHIVAAEPHLTDVLEMMRQGRRAVREQLFAQILDVVERLDVAQASALAETRAEGGRTNYLRAYVRIQYAARAAILDIRGRLEEAGIEAPQSVRDEVEHLAKAVG